jgi:hypothetical protein
MNQEVTKSAWKVCGLSGHHLRTPIDKGQTRKAVLTQHAQIAFEFSWLTPDLKRLALARIRFLGAGSTDSVGGLLFPNLVRVFGISLSLPLRKLTGGILPFYPRVTISICPLRTGK